MNRILVALIGPQGSGKEYLARAIEEHYGLARVQVFSTGNIVRKTATLWGLPEGDRPICEEIVQMFVGKFGGDVLAKAIESNIQKSDSRVAVFDCVRRPEDWQMVLRLGDSGMHVRPVFLDRSQKDRYAGLRERKRGQEGDLSWESFLAHEKLPQEQFVQTIGGESGVIRLPCFGGAQELDEQKREFCRTHLPNL